MPTRRSRRHARSSASTEPLAGTQREREGTIGATATAAGRPPGARPPDPFRLPTGAFGFPAATEHRPRASIQDVLPYLGISLDDFGRRLVGHWDQQADAFYLMAVRAIGAWLDYLIALPMPVRIPAEELRKLRGPADPAFLEMQHHAYMQATLALGDGLAAGLAGHPRPALAMLRPFIESAIAEVYIHGDGEGRRLWRYLDYLAGTGHRPRYRQMLDAIFQESRFASLASLRDLVDTLYGGISTSAHVQTPDEALLSMRDGNQAVATYPELVFWLGSLGLVVHRMLTLLVLRFPMTLFPVDIERRFAYNPPVGLYSDKVVSASVREGLGVRHADALASFLRNDEEIGGLLEWFESRPELTDEQIDADWERSRREARQPPKQEVPRGARWAFVKAEMAAMQWATDIGLAIRLVPPEPDIDPDELLRRSTLAAELRPYYSVDDS
jgi:hypothetical protein